MKTIGKEKVILHFCDDCNLSYYINFPFYIKDFHAFSFGCIICGVEPVQARKRKAPENVKVTCYSCVACEKDFNVFFLHFDKLALTQDLWLYCPICKMRKVILRKNKK